MNLYIDWRNVVTRAVWTLAQSFAAVVTAVNVAPGTPEELKGIGVTAGAAALAAGLSFVKTLVAEIIDSVKFNKSAGK